MVDQPSSSKLFKTFPKTSKLGKTDLQDPAQGGETIFNEIHVLDAKVIAARVAHMAAEKNASAGEQPPEDKVGETREEVQKHLKCLKEALDPTTQKNVEGPYNPFTGSLVGTSGMSEIVERRLMAETFFARENGQKGWLPKEFKRFCRPEK